MQLTTIKAKPFLKWAGGKAQLIEHFVHYLPDELTLGKLHRYVEPFIGGGALFFHIAQMYNIEGFFISDVNEELILVYKSIQKDVESLINLLKAMERKYHRLSPSRQKEYFYAVRFQLNENRSSVDFTSYSEVWVERTAQIIFLNRTCFNGLFRVNSKGEFNVPFGKYKNPLICAEDNLHAVSELLQRTEIRLGDFSVCESFVNSDTFVYFDPPYRPISKTASFTSYSKYDFDDATQLRLASFYRLLDRNGAKLMLSNSDPKNENPKDRFFENAYKNFYIERVKANRMINCNAEKRGAINELLIMNY
ncbi:MAG: DNA adenine methylase [Ignavibacteriales bacterium]|nr:DNA adenine methylase [Ignavibacteriales bacterium]